MIDRDRILKGLETCSKLRMACWECPYLLDPDNPGDCIKELMEDALDLIKEQPEIVRCKDCLNRECEGRDGKIVCGIDGSQHEPKWFCADGE